METGLYEITFKDGRIFRVFAANKRQKERLLKLFGKIGRNETDRNATMANVRNGIHTIKQLNS